MHRPAATWDRFVHALSGWRIYPNTAFERRGFAGVDPRGACVIEPTSVTIGCDEVPHASSAARRSRFLERTARRIASASRDADVVRRGPRAVAAPLVITRSSTGYARFSSRSRVAEATWLTLQHGNERELDPIARGLAQPRSRVVGAVRVLERTSPLTQNSESPARPHFRCADRGVVREIIEITADLRRDAARSRPRQSASVRIQLAAIN